MKQQIPRVFVSVLLATKDRHNALSRCIASLCAGTYKDFEIIIVDQTASPYSSHISHANVRYIHDPRRGKGKALNLALSRARGDICAFIDDDCIASKNWLRSIQDAFSKHPSISGVFGKTLPFTKKGLVQTKYCPAIYLPAEDRIISSPCYHADHIGFGNNMAFRTNVCRSIREFTTLLGPGSIGLAALDAEFALKALEHNYRILSTPNVLVYHNKWLNAQQLERQNNIYVCGEIACYGYYAFHGYPFAQHILYRDIQNMIKKTRQSISFNDYWHSLVHLSYISRGFLVATLYSVNRALTSKHVSR